MPRASDLLAATLQAHGVDRVFCVPGESFLALLDSLADEKYGVDVVTCRHEAGAGLMALGDAKATGRAGTVLVSRGPGACNASIALHSAQQDAVPLVMIVGQVEAKDRYRDAFQEVDYTRAFAGVVKWSCEVSDPERISELAAAAYEMAVSGTPGPVIVAIPEDVFMLPATAAVAPSRRRPEAVPSEALVLEVGRRLEAAAKPLLIAGTGARSQRARQALLDVSEAWRIPVALTNKHQDVFPNQHPHYAGHLGYAAPRRLMSVLGEADLVLAVGTRLGDVQTQGYTFPRAPVPDQTLIHVHSDPAQIGRVHVPALGLVADPPAFLETLARLRSGSGHDRSAWLERVHAAAADVMRWSPRHAGDGIDFGWVVAALATELPEDAVITLDSGNFVSWVHAHFPFKSSHLLIGAVSGAMGLGVPAAVSAALRFPGRAVVGLVGDGGFLMTGNELATALRKKVPVRIFVANNRSYGTIRTHQERVFPGRVMATDLVNPDFAALAEAFGARGLRIESAEQAREVVKSALATPGPVVVDVRTSLELISANTTVTALRSARS